MIGEAQVVFPVGVPGRGELSIASNTIKVWAANGQRHLEM